MIKAQRTMDNGTVGFGATPDQIFAAAGYNKTGTYDGMGMPVDGPPASQHDPEDAQQTSATASPTETAQQVTPSIEFDWNGKFDGRFKSFDELESYVKEVEGKANKDPFANDLVRNLNKAISEGVDPELYMAVSQIDVENLSAKDALILEMQWKKGLTYDDAEFIVNRTYKLEDAEDEPDMSDPEVREAQIRLGLDSKSAKDFLGQYKQEALRSPYEKMQEELTQAWTPAIPKVMENWKSFQVNSKGGNYTIPTSPGAIEAANNLLKEIISNGLLENMPDKEGIAIANAIVEKEILKHDFQHAIDYVVEAMKAKQLEEKHNPRKPQGQAAPSPVPQDGVIGWLKGIRS
jgi:hypothetical protein